MSTEDFNARALASLQQVVVGELIPDIASREGSETAANVARIVSRLKLSMYDGNRISASHLEQWQQLANDSGTIVAPADNDNSTADFSSLSNRISEAVRRISDDQSGAKELSQSSSKTAHWFEQAIEATKSYIDAWEGALTRLAENPASPRSDPDVLRKKLDDYLHARYPQLPHSSIVSLAIIPGGGSKETAVFELVKNDLLPCHLVLRRDMGNTPTGTSVFGEFELLKNLGNAGLPVPAAVLAEKDAAHLGGGFILVGEVRDAVQVGHLFPELNDMSRLHPSFGADLARALARLHKLDERSLGAGLGGHHAAADPLDMVLNFQKLWRSFKTKPPMAVATELGFAWLLSHPLPANRTRGLVHGDVGMHNMMMREGRLEAILDWELTHMGDPAEDIGYMRAPLMLQIMSWEDFVAAYLHEGGDEAACNLQAVNWYSVWAHTRNSVYTSLYYDLAARGERSDIRAFASGMDYLPRAQHYLMRELATAVQNQNIDN